VTIPQINTEMDLLNIQKLPYFRVMISLGMVSDIVYTTDGQGNTAEYEPALGGYNGCNISNISDWFSTNDLIDEQTMTVKLDDSLIEQMTADTTVLLSIGMEFGNVGLAGLITPVKRAGCGKILDSE